MPYVRGRGINVCERWNTFDKFFADMGECPPGHSIDRIDPNGNYEPSNCRWLPKRLQNRTWRKAIMVKWNGKEKNLAELCEESGKCYNVVRERLKLGWQIERAITQPVRELRRCV